MSRNRLAFARLVLSLALSLSVSVPGYTIANTTPPPQPGSSPDATRKIYLPIVFKPHGPPSFVIVELKEGTTVPSTFSFGIQTSEPSGISNVVFKANTTTFATDSTAGDGFQTIADLSGLTEGVIALSATANGPGGQTTKSVNVKFVKSLPQSATVTSIGATLATTTGSSIALYAGAVPSGTAVSVQERTQQQVTNDAGIKWDDLGVTFLGAVQIQTTANIQRPFGVTSVGFGNRVQPGQAIVNYRIMPDQDGDGVGELVAVNGASLAANGNIVSAPIPELLISSIQGSPANLARGPQANPSAKPGSVITLRGTGFNIISRNGNVAIFKSLVNGQERRVPGLASQESPSSTVQLLKVVVPVLPVGRATLTIHNESSAASVDMGEVDILAGGALSGTPVSILQTFLNQSEAWITALPATQPQAAGYRAQALAQIPIARQQLAVLATATESYVQDFLNEAALIVQSVDMPTASTRTHGPQEPKDLTPAEETTLGNFVSAYNALAALAALAGAIGLGATAGVATPAILAIGVIGGSFWLASALLDLYIKYEKQARPGCPSLISQLANLLTGMGSVTPSGGSGCGGANGGSGGGSLLLAGNQAERAEAAPSYFIKIFTRSTPRRTLTPFTGSTDPGGYFFIPTIPNGEPFLAVATDQTTGASATFEGTGVPVGQSTYMYFDFSQAQANVFNINIGDTITNGVPITGAGNIETPGGLDIYQFNASAGQQIFVDSLSRDNGLSSLDWELQDSTGAKIFDSCLGCGDPGVITLTLSGPYVLRVGGGSNASTGAYSFKLWTVPAPQQFAISIGDTISNGVPSAGAGNIESPGATDIYVFGAAAGQQVFFDVQAQTGIAQVHWRLVNAIGTVVFDTCLGCGDVGTKTLALAGTYTLTVNRNTEDGFGTYRFQLWNVPAPQQFAINVGDTISNGLPSAGAGNIESPGAYDIYTFNAAPGQQVFFDMQTVNGTTFVEWQLTDSMGTKVFDVCLGCGDPGVKALVLGGTYTLTVGDSGDDGFGTYRFQLWNATAPQQFAVNVGDTVSNGLPSAGAGNIESPGVFDVYTFNAAPGQQVFFDMQEVIGTTFVEWQLTDSIGTKVFDVCLGCGDPGVKTLALGGAYTLTVGDGTEDKFGTYRFKLWNVPTPQQFAINVGDTISNGLPSAGAGNIESPGALDIYTFSATPGQQVLFDVQGITGVTFVSWKLTDGIGTKLFDACLGCGDPGTKTLTLGGTYTITVGDTDDDGFGTYQFQLRNP